MAALLLIGTAGASPILFTKDSTNSEPIGLSTDSKHCTLSRSELGDYMSIASNSTRCTWTNQHFSHMKRHEVFDIDERFDQHGTTSSWENNILIRPTGPYGTGCGGGGNAENMLITIRVVTVSGSQGHWKLELRGGNSLENGDHEYHAVDLGPIVDGQTVNFKFDVIYDYAHGAATVWKNGAEVYNDRDMPLGFHFDCSGGDISNDDLRMQHGVYRGWRGPMQFTSSGFRFYVSEPAP